MVQSNPTREARVSPSMVQSVFCELKANGYSDAQIVALAAGLAVLARERQLEEPEPLGLAPIGLAPVGLEPAADGIWGARSPEMDLSLLGLPASAELTWVELTD